MTLELELGGRQYRVTVMEVGRPPSTRLAVSLMPLDRDGAASLDRQFDVQPTADGCSLIDTATGQVVDAALTAGSGGQWLVQLAGIDVNVTVNGRRRAAAATADTGGEQLICAPMPGRVLKVLVEPGAVVAAGQPLVVIEAMKMENGLAAARPGVVEDVAVREGTSVEAGRLLVRLR